MKSIRPKGLALPTSGPPGAMWLLQLQAPGPRGFFCSCLEFVRGLSSGDDHT